MMTEKQLDAALEQLFRDIRFQGKPAGLYDPLRYMIALGGKRLRPRLCLLTWSFFQDTPGEEILQPAAGLEVFHTFTLIHDDVMDRSALRRGSETVWKKWNPDTAILSGDVMCIDAYKRIAQAPRAVLPQVLELFSRTAAEVCDGQQMDMDFEQRSQVGMDEYMRSPERRRPTAKLCTVTATTSVWHSRWRMTIWMLTGTKRSSESPSAETS